MKKYFKLFTLCIVALLTFASSGCKKDETVDTAESKGCTLEDVNAFLNDKTTMNMDAANTVAIIPFEHVNGPRNEWKFYALVNFQYKERAYVKYQVTYLSCTCRAANVNYWQTAYVELTTPTDPNNARVQKLSFDADGTGHYTAGFWGDSSPIFSESTGLAIATYEKTHVEDFISFKINEANASEMGYDVYSDVYSIAKNGVTYKVRYDDKYLLTIGNNEEVEMSATSNENEYSYTNGVDTYYITVTDNSDKYYPSIKEDFIPLVVGKTKTQIMNWRFVDDMEEDGALDIDDYSAYSNGRMQDNVFDAFTGASVSTNNIIRILRALFEYHTNTWYK